MDFFTFDGFICAVLSGPNNIMPSEWLRWVWDQERGEQSPESSFTLLLPIGVRTGA
jgi:uncharacterized protein